jgi:DNA-binding NarL/FixJ family response regulator
MVREWQFLDRPAEDELIRSALSGGRGGGMVVVGPAGVGKTALARAVTATLPTARVHWVACTESSRIIPLGAFAQWVGDSAADNPAGQIAAARRALLADGDVVIGIDDAHLLDPLSATLLHNIAIERATRIVATVRSTEQVPEVLISLWKDGYLRWLELQPFTRRETAALLESVLGGTVEELSADFIWQSSEGNPLFLRHLVAGALEAGTLREADGVWQIRGRAQVSAGLASLLDTRLDGAGAPALSVLKLLALCEPLDLDALVELAGVDAVDAAEQADLIRIADGGGALRVRIAHPLYGDVMRRRIGAASAREARGRIAAVLRTRDINSAGRRIQLAQLYADSDQDADVFLLLTAGQDALSVADLPLAERLARAAVRQGEKMPPGERGPFLLAARLMLFRSAMLQGRGSEAKAIVDEMTPENPDDDVQLVRWWGAPLMGIRFFATGEVSEAHQVLEMLRSRVTDPAMNAILEGYDAVFAVQENQLERGVAAAEALLSNPDAPPLAIEGASFAAGQALSMMGRGKEFEPIAHRVRATENPEAMIGILARYTDVLALSMVGDLDAAEQRAAAYAQFSSLGQYVGWAVTKVMAALVANYRGQFTDVISPIEQALAALVGEDTLPWQLPAQLLLARAHAALGRPEEADRVMAEADRHMGPHMAIYGPQVTLANAWVAAARGGDRTAITLARKAAEAARQAGQYAVEAEALHDAARFGDRAVSARLSWLATRVQGRPAELYARHAAALAGGDGTALDAASEQFERAGLLLSAADAAAQAAPLHERAGHRGRSAESADRAARLAERGGGFVTPAIVATARPLPLSSREREIATLISAGLTNRQIAERLSVSVRTVEGHIYRGCTKLDASDREEFAAIVRQSGTG